MRSENEDGICWARSATASAAAKPHRKYYNGRWSQHIRPCGAVYLTLHAVAAGTWMCGVLLIRSGSANRIISFLGGGRRGGVKPP